MKPPITKKFVFEEKLKGNPIHIYVNEITDEEIQCLIDCGILRQFTPNCPRRVEELNLIIALYPIINIGLVNNIGPASSIGRRRCEPGDTVRLRW